MNEPVFALTLGHYPQVAVVDLQVPECGKIDGQYGGHIRDVLTTFPVRRVHDPVRHA